MSWSEVMNDIFELNESCVVIQGSGDIILAMTSPNMGEYVFKEFTSNNFWTILGGKSTDEMVIETMTESGFSDIDSEGEWEFKAILKYINSECDEYGRVYLPSYLEIKHIEWRFIQTFKQRDREEKFNSIGLFGF